MKREGRGFNIETNKENAIEFITGEKTATVSVTNRKYINKLKKLHEKHQSDFIYFVENKDRSICAKIPLNWIKISIPRQVSDKQRQLAADRFKRLHDLSLSETL